MVVAAHTSYNLCQEEGLQTTTYKAGELSYLYIPPLVSKTEEFPHERFCSCSIIPTDTSFTPASIWMDVLYANIEDYEGFCYYDWWTVSEISKKLLKTVNYSFMLLLMQLILYSLSTS